MSGLLERPQVADPAACSPRRRSRCRSRAISTSARSSSSGPPATSSSTAPTGRRRSTRSAASTATTSTTATRRCSRPGRRRAAVRAPARAPGVARSLHVRATFSRRHTLDDDFEVIPTPGHTSGATAYLWDTGEDRLLFTGDTIYLRDGEWVAAMLESSDRAGLPALARAHPRPRLRRPRPVGGLARRPALRPHVPRGRDRPHRRDHRAPPRGRRPLGQNERGLPIRVRVHAPSPGFLPTPLRRQRATLEAWLMLIAADYPFLEIFWTMIVFFVWVAWIWTLVMVLVRRVPLGPVRLGEGGLDAARRVPAVPRRASSYLIAHGKEMGERRVRDMEPRWRARTTRYGQARRPATAAAAEIADAQEAARHRRHQRGGVRAAQGQGPA